MLTTNTQLLLLAIVSVESLSNEYYISHSAVCSEASSSGEGAIARIDFSYAFSRPHLSALAFLS